MNAEITIVDRGRGPQLSTSRITVQDVVPYLQLKCGYDEILRIMPSLSVDEIKAIQCYVKENYDEVMAEDRRIRDVNATRRNPPHVEELRRRTQEKWPAIQERLRQRLTEVANGDGHSG
ncbi:MAG TPA: hypothetical protein VNH11_29640 [Pirellulales bacterium]|nr:hypothetical protein [Pirellulales bacterium]HVC96637.1 hypothetical protein [Pirellulales bacterium]